MVFQDSCGKCRECNPIQKEEDNLFCEPCYPREQLCEEGPIMTYQGDLGMEEKNILGNEYSKTIGGYSSKFVVKERFAIKIPEEYPLEMVYA